MLGCAISNIFGIGIGQKSFSGVAVKPETRRIGKGRIRECCFETARDSAASLLRLDLLLFSTKRLCASAFQKFFCIDFAKNFDERGNGPGPPRLMAGADAGTVVAMEVFIEQQIVPPVRIPLKLVATTENRPPPVSVAQENAGQAIGNFACYLEQVDQSSGAGRALDFEVAAVIGVEVQQ